MIIAIDLDNTCITSDMWLYKLLNINPDAGPIRRVNPFKVNRADINNQTRLNKFISLLSPKNYYAVRGAQQVINKLYLDNTIIFLSSRPSCLKSVLHLTKKNIENAGLMYDAIFLNCSNKDKFCKDFNVDIFIDNSLKQCKSVDAKSSAKTICYNPKLKDNTKVDSVYCINNWRDIYNCCNMLVARLVEGKNYLSQEFINMARQNFANNIKEKIYNVFDYTSINTVKKLQKQLINTNNVQRS